ncbi:MAG: Xaa-Pro dipeptidase [Actinobacteria bacterium HGW-Actinobacteria-6]|jgi:Xaa-Pro aminopeptidase|nr:MAG: Xaa-Pro dipeptidase [Actinobacteria bacterium HGW-Actinobacteria-6]
MYAEPRLAALRKRLSDDGIQAVLLTGVSNMRYLTGFDDVFDPMINAACLVTSEFARFYTDHRYSEAAEQAAEGTPWSVRIPAESLYIDACAELHEDGISELGLEASVPYGRFKFISEQFVGGVRVLDHLVEDLRQVKESHELDRVEAAARLTDRAFDHILGFVGPGKSEREIALELEFFMRTNGSDDVAFDPIVASGPNSARPHASVSDRIMGDGEFLKLDFGARIDGYCSDMTRTMVIGKASDRHREIYSAVLAANRAGVAAVRAGVPCKDVDAAARRVLEDLGFAEYFTHGLGHGVGLDIHEMPTLGRRSHDSLRVGSVVTIEPGVYMPGFGGVRIEDLLAVEEAGGRVLSASPRELIEI